MQLPERILPIFVYFDKREIYILTAKTKKTQKYVLPDFPIINRNTHLTLNHVLKLYGFKPRFISKSLLHKEIYQKASALLHYYIYAHIVIVSNMNKVTIEEYGDTEWLPLYRVFGIHFKRDSSIFKLLVKVPKYVDKIHNIRLT